MSVNEITVEAPPPAVWEVLADPPSYEEWVVGNKDVRGHDPGWPSPGSEFHHTVGFGPLAVKDKTVSLEAAQPRRLVMNVRALPVGHGVVTLELTEAGAGTVVRMEERPAGGPMRLLWPAFDPLVKLRNAETLRRLKRLAESRHESRTRR
ncbi:MAG: SRPBCC family protein [Actinomycetota bacterium]|jgi:uncharacterized protein YndB with AHSA1/START domain